MKTLILVENETITINQSWELSSKGKGGKTLYTEDERTMRAKECKKFFSKIYNMLVIAELYVSDWYLGSCSILEYAVLRQGMFEIDNGELIPIMEEPYQNLRIWNDLPGNGTVSVNAFTKEASDNYKAFIWPNGRKCCYVKEYFN